MAGRLVVSTLNNDTGVLATQNGMTGIPKAWVLFNGITTATIRGSFNVSSVTRNGTGDYTINFTTAMADTNYAVSGAAGNGSINNSVGAVLSAPASANPTTSAVRVQTYQSHSLAVGEFPYISVIVLGS